MEGLLSCAESARTVAYLRDFPSTVKRPPPLKNRRQTPEQPNSTPSQSACHRIKACAFYTNADTQTNPSPTLSESWSETLGTTRKRRGLGGRRNRGRNRPQRASSCSSIGRTIKLSALCRLTDSLFIGHPTNPKRWRFYASSSRTDSQHPLPGMLTFH